MNRANAEPAGAVPTVLVAEDDQDIRELLDILLVDSGYQPLLARNGQEALDLSREHVVHLALLDVAMPGGMSGIEVTRRLRSEPSTRTLPVLLLSALAQERDVAAGLAAGADEYLIKPFEPAVLLDRVRSMLATEG